MLREIDERVSDNLCVTLYWESDNNTLTVGVEDRTVANGVGDFTLTDIPVEDRELAFMHPYTYAHPRKAAA